MAKGRSKYNRNFKFKFKETPTLDQKTAEKTPNNKKRSIPQKVSTKFNTNQDIENKNSVKKRLIFKNAELNTKTKIIKSHIHKPSTSTKEETNNQNIDLNPKSAHCSSSSSSEDSDSPPTKIFSPNNQVDSNRDKPCDTSNSSDSEDNSDRSISNTKNSSKPETEDIYLSNIEYTNNETSNITLSPSSQTKGSAIFNELSSDDDEISIIDEKIVKLPIISPESIKQEIKQDPDSIVNNYDSKYSELESKVDNQNKIIDSMSTQLTSIFNLLTNQANSDNQNVKETSSSKTFKRPHIEASPLDKLKFQPNKLNKPRFTGVKSHATVDMIVNEDIDPSFWKKHPYLDPTAPMCSPQELKDFVEIHELQHLKEEIAPWFTTAKPIDATDKRYWTHTSENGTEHVSRTRAMNKFFFNKGDPLEEKDKCVICSKYLISEYHQYMLVYQHTPNPNKSTLWKWKNSQMKACYLHFHNSKSSFIEGRSPYKYNKTDHFTSLHPSNNLDDPIIELDDTDKGFPDEY